MFESKKLKITVILFAVFIWTMGLFAITEQILFVKNQMVQGTPYLKANLLKSIQKTRVQSIAK